MSGRYFIYIIFFFFKFFFFFFGGGGTFTQFNLIRRCVFGGFFYLVLIHMPDESYCE